MIINSFVNSNILFGNNTKNTKKYYPLNNGNDLFIKTTRDDRIKNDVEYNKILEKIILILTNQVNHYTTMRKI